MKYISGKSLGWYFSKTARVVISKYNENLSQIDVSAQQTGVLFLLYEMEQQGEIATQSSISRYLFLNKVSTHSLVKNLLKKDMITKKGSLLDKRYNHVGLTEKGRALIPQLKEVDEKIETELKNLFVPSQMDKQAFEKIKDYLYFFLKSHL